jgi:hypothetical protein
MQNRYKKQSCGQKMYRFKNQTRLYFSQLFFSTLLSWVTTNINQYPNINEYQKTSTSINEYQPISQYQ